MQTEPVLKMKYKFLIVGGSPYEGYKGTVFTGLNVVGHADTLEEAEKVFNDKNEVCAGLLMVIDCEAGEAADMGYNRKELDRIFEAIT
jgi:hypothetical protein